jgi:hypothetical protein
MMMSDCKYGVISLYIFLGDHSHIYDSSIMS